MVDDKEVKKGFEDDETEFVQLDYECMELLRSALDLKQICHYCKENVKDKKYGIMSTKGKKKIIVCDSALCMSEYFVEHERLKEKPCCSKVRLEEREMHSRTQGKLQRTINRLKGVSTNLKVVVERRKRQNTYDADLKSLMQLACPKKYYEVVGKLSKMTEKELVDLRKRHVNWRKEKVAKK